MQYKVLSALVAVGALTGMAAAQTAGPSAPTAAAAAAQAFGAREQILDASLSPDGTKVAFITPGPQQSTIVRVLDINAGTAKSVNYANGNPLTLTGCGWASNSRLVCSLYGVSNIEGGWQPYSRLIALDADGGNVAALGIMQTIQEYVANSDGYVMDWRDGKTGKVLIARNYVPLKANIITVGSQAVGLGVDLVDTATGRAEHIESPDGLIGSYIADGQGNVRIKQQYDSYRFSNQGDGKVNFYYRLAGSKTWKPFSTYDEIGRSGMYPLAVDGTKDVAYVIDKKDGRDALYRVALDGSMRKELAFASDTVDVRGVSVVGRSGHVVGATYVTDARTVAYFDPQYEALHAKLSKALDGASISIVDSSADEKQHLFFASSASNPGQYYLYDSSAKRLIPLGAERPQLTGAQLGTVSFISYPAADGAMIPAYLTVPAGVDPHNAPAIVMPHGGPGSRDTGGFDWLSQFFVSRGYVVIQPQFRGSTGFGDAWFKKNGFKSWRTAIGDVNDAGRWLVKEGKADPAKLAIFGWSYGGYAALQANVLDPDLFKAVIAVAPVTDIGLLRGQTTQTVEKKDIGEGAQIAEGSPARHAKMFKAPVLLFHGTKDINVYIAESKLMDKELRGAGKSSQLVVYPDNDHQLRDSAVRIDMLTKADAFLRKSLGL